MWGAEIGANEHGVVIGNEAVFTRELLLGRTEPDALLGMDLVRLGLERATTATEAVAVMVELLEAHGQGGSCSHDHPKFRYHNSFLVADADGATVLETAGRAWATEAATGAGRAISNGLTIPAFAKAHADPIKSRVTGCQVRRARTEPAAATARGPADLFAVLRDHGPHGHPHWSRVHGGLTAPCVHAGGTLASSQTTASWVADLRGDPQHWATATSGPCTSIFKPVSVHEPVDLGPAPTNVVDDRTTWWRHEPLHRLTLRDHAASIARYGPERDRTEAMWLDDVPTSAHAFAVAGTLEHRWLDDLWEADLPDRRPRWMRQQWHGFDQAAGR
jgi:dipeptidase